MCFTNKKSLYIHIPFCGNKCSYCGFYSIPYDSNLASSCVGAISKEVNSIGYIPDTIYIGGGTPTILESSQLKKILNNLKKYLCAAQEFTVEANPESLNRENLSLFLDHGVNRISIGAQSFNDDKLKRLGRIHNAASAKKAVETAKKEGFENLNLDLIFGVEGEDPESWRRDLKEAMLLPVKHISCYSLTHDKDLKPIDEDTMVEMYEYAIAYLEDNGFKQYEISNFALDGYQCRHNMNYWRGNPYRGVGPSAVSYEEYSREENVADVREYASKVLNGESSVASKEKLSPENRAREAAAVKIRTIEGIDLEWFREHTGFDFMGIEKEAVRRIEEDGLVKCGEGRVRLTKRGILLCDIVSSAFL